jgi:hypothetical protein
VDLLWRFTWSEKGVILATETNVSYTTLVHTFNLGVHIVTLNATDEAGNTGTDTVTVTIETAAGRQYPNSVVLP